MAVVAGVVLIRGIATPLAAAVALLGEIARGDLSRNAPAGFQARGDEIGTLTRTMQTMIVSLRKMIQDISGEIGVLSSSSTELMNSSIQMTSGSRDASDKAHTVSAAAADMSSSIASVAAGMEQATTNLANVSSSTEQMASTSGAPGRADHRSDRRTR
jgi:methyl-accepting chemotaxis protein